MKCNRSPTKAAFAKYDDADRASVNRGLKPYRCHGCGLFHLTSQGMGAKQVEVRRTIRALHTLRSRGITGPLRDAAEAKAKELGIA